MGYAGCCNEYIVYECIHKSGITIMQLLAKNTYSEWYYLALVIQVVEQLISHSKAHKLR